MTDVKGRRAARGWICFDSECAVCTMLACRFRRLFEKRGFGFAALQDPRVASLLGLTPEQLLREMRVVTAGGVYGGADAVAYLAKQVWWAWPVYLAAKLPPLRSVLRWGYRWFADHRSCTSDACLGAQKRHRAQG